MTARARRRAVDRAQECDWVQGDPDALDYAEAAADAASDVWEPLLEDALAGLKQCRVRGTAPDPLLIDRLERALHA